MARRRQLRGIGYVKNLCVEGIDVDVLECGSKERIRNKAQSVTDLLARLIGFGILRCLGYTLILLSGRGAGLSAGGKGVQRILSLAIYVRLRHHVIVIISKVTRIAQTGKCG